MIIDGRKVLYSMKGGVIQDPSIPTDGLVCYLDARGKTNSDKHKATLLDLSGNGNRGTLLNFSFTEESGYVKDSSVVVTSGLQFDGVDDSVTPIPFDTTVTDEYTAYIDFTLTDNLPNIRLVPILRALSDVFILSISLTTHRLRYHVANLDGDTGYLDSFKKLQLGNRHKIIVVRDGLIFKIYVDGVKITEKTFNAKTRQRVGYLYTFNNIAGSQLNPSELHKVALYNRALTDEEATKLMEV